MARQKRHDLTFGQLEAGDVVVSKHGARWKVLEVRPAGAGFVNVTWKLTHLPGRISLDQYPGPLVSIAKREDRAGVFQVNR